MASFFTQEKFKKLPVIGIVRGLTVGEVIPLVKCYLQAGFHTLEVTWNSPGPQDAIRHLIHEFGEDLQIGAGTILSHDDMERALNAGARFIVTPIVDAGVITASVDQRIPIFPGAYTPTEIHHAWRLGATAVKLFPAEIGGLAYVKSVLAPLSSVPVLPTGGVSPENVLDFLAAGVFGVGMGSQLFPKAYLQTKNWTALTSYLGQLQHKITSR